MKARNRSNALLLELLIVVAFFMLASTTLLRVFSAARQQSANAELLSVAAAEAQNIADQLYAAEDGEALLVSMEFVKQDKDWKRESEDFAVTVSRSLETEEQGTLVRQSVRVTDVSGNTLIELPCSCWREVPRDE